MSGPETSSGSRGLLLGLEDFIDQAVFLGLNAAHVEIALDVARDIFAVFARRPLQDVRDHVLDVTNLASLDFDVGRLPTGATEGLVDHDPRMRERETTAFGARAEQHRAHAGR